MEDVRGVEAGRAGVSLNPDAKCEGLGAAGVEDCENEGDDACTPWFGWSAWP